MLDLADHGNASRAVRETLRIAAAPEGFLYRLGPHAGLLLRLLDWVKDSQTSLLNKCRRQFKKQVRKHPFAPESIYWKLANAVADLYDDSPVFARVPGVALAVNRYHFCRAAGDSAAEPLQVYLDRFENIFPPKSPVRLPQREIVFLISPKLSLEDEYPLLKSCLKAAAVLIWAGAQVLLVGRADRSTGYIEGIPFLGLKDFGELNQILRSLQPLDVLIAVGYPDLPNRIAARQVLVYDLQMADDENFTKDLLGAVRQTGRFSPLPLVMQLTLKWGQLERLLEDDLPDKIKRFRLRVADAVRRRLMMLERRS
jgi:hypothetical protein